MLPALSLVTSAVCGLLVPEAWLLKCALIPLAIIGWIAWWCCRGELVIPALVAAFCIGGAVLAADAHEDALQTPLRAALDREFGGFSIGSARPSPRHDPIAARVMLLDDASREDEGATLRGL